MPDANASMPLAGDWTPVQQEAPLQRHHRQLQPPKAKRGALFSAAMPGNALLALLPAELLARVLSHISLIELPAALLALQLTCTAWRMCIHGTDDLFVALSARMRHAVENGGTPRGRRSARLERSASAEFAQSVKTLRTRSEYLVHALTSMAQDSRDLSLSKVRKALATWSPCLLNRVSPISNATPLMEVCRARGCTEAVILAAVTELVVGHGASVNVGNSGDCQTPLIIAAARGLPRVVSFLLEHGADPLQQGFGRFRAMAASNTAGALSGGVVRGTLSPLEWTEAVIARERAGGVTAKAQRSLLQCAELLRAAVAEDAGARLPIRPTAVATERTTSSGCAATDYEMKPSRPFRLGSKKRSSS